MKSSTILYVNFSPYSNAGSILDYLLSEFTTVVCVTFHFYSLGKKQTPPEVTIYRNKEVYKKISLIQVPVPLKLQFILLPLRSLIIFIQLFIIAIYLRLIDIKPSMYLSVNGFTSWVGNILRTFGLVEKTIFWVWDYYPPIHHNIFIAIMRNLYTFFDLWAISDSNSVIFLNRRIAKARNIETLNDKPLRIVPIGTRLSLGTPNKFQLVFFGVLKKSQGLQTIIKLLKDETMKKYTLHVIGNGPDKSYFERLAKNATAKIIFHGYIPNDNDIDKIIGNCSIGLAPYLPEKDSVTPYTDPSKLKRYISNGLPVLTTNITEFSSDIEQTKSGIIINSSVVDLKRGIKLLENNYDFYRKNAINLSKKYNYLKLYKQITAL